jgi:hypothetical protein
MSSAEEGLSEASSEGAPAGAAGGTAIEVGISKRVRKQTAKLRSSKVLPQGVRRTGNVKGLTSTGGGGGGAKGAHKGSKGKTAQHDQIDSTFRDDGGGVRSSKKGDVMNELLDMLKKDANGGESVRARALRMLQAQQNTIEATLSTLLSRREKLKRMMNDVDSGDSGGEAEDIQDELDEITGRRKLLRKTAVALEAEIQQKGAAVARERRDAVASHQLMRREREKHARLLNMGDGEDQEEQEEGEPGNHEEGEEGSQEDCEDGGG